MSLANTQFISCTFKSCDLSNVAFANARLREISFQDCKLLGIQWFQLADLTNPSFKECILDYCNFDGMKLKKTTFSKCIFRDADLSQADFSECDFRESDFMNARFQSTSLLKADFRGAMNLFEIGSIRKVRGARFNLPEAQGLLAGLGIIIDR